MKKIVAFCLLCVIFLLFSNTSLTVFASTNTYGEQIEFVYNNNLFEYNLQKNIKQSNLFSFNYNINKYNRFSSPKERQLLLSKMLDMGLDKKIVLEYLFPNITKTINRISKNIYTKPVDAILKINSNTNKVFHITKEKLGITLNENTLYDLIIEKFLNNKTLLINVPTTTLLPDVYEKDLKVYSCLRADFSTDISSSSQDRKHNIKNALNRLNKAEIMPNETFSFNKTIGKRTQENGYRQAKIIVNNEFVDGLGGGVCQVSSTLYNTALLAGLEILEANKHSKQVHYVKYGFDAMVNYGSSDLKFKNNTNHKLTIITNFSQSKLRIRIFGEDLNNVSYKLKNEILNTTEPIEEIVLDEKNEYTDKVIYEDEFFYLKTANKGMEIKSYREQYVNGTLTNTELLRHDKFKVQNAVKVYGTKKRAEDAARDFFIPFDLLGKYNLHT